MQEMMKKRAVELLKNGSVARVLGWKKGEFDYDITPAVFESTEQIENEFIYNSLCSPNLSKYLVKESKKEGKTLVFLKPCDSYSLSQLITEHRVHRENIYAVAIECYGKTDADTIKAKGIKGITKITENDGVLNVETLYGNEKVPVYEVLRERCVNCKSKKHPVYDEIIGDEGETVDDCERFNEVERIERMSPEERFEFFRGELSRCIRCNACRNVCPACTCEKCVFDNDASGIAQKAASDSFEENMFHIIRAFHVAGRCTDCGECSRVCPQNIPLHLLNRKFIKDINELYGNYQAGETTGSRSPLTDYTQNDAEPDIVYKRGGKDNA